jgi:peptidyl-prolyl cis-trans isomerase D
MPARSWQLLRKASYNHRLVSSYRVALMFEQVRKHRRAIQIVLGAVFLPFAFWGTDSMMSNPDKRGTVAQVGDQEIGIRAFEEALREQQDRLRTTLGNQVDTASILNSPQLRASVLDQLVNRALIAQQESRFGLVAPDERLRQLITHVPQFQENGQFSKSLYDLYLSRRGMTPEIFEKKLAQDMTMQQLHAALSEASMPGRTASAYYASMLSRAREIAQANLSGEAFRAQVKIDESAVQQWYDAHKTLYTQPEQIRAQYLILDARTLASSMNPQESAILAYYESHRSGSGAPEERRARHILLSLAPDAPAAEVERVRKRAQALREQLRKTPQDFERMAKEQSQDPGSAAQGGDLGWFARGVMVPAFDQAVFALKDKEISEPVRTDFGFHVIAVDGIKKGREKTLDELRPDIVTALREEMATKRFNELADAFTNAVYDQPDTLTGVAEQFQLSLRTSGWLSRQGGQKSAPFDQPKLIDALFSDEAIKQKLNTRALDVGPGQLLAARVLEHKPAAVQALADVASEIRHQLTEQASVQRAIEEGRSRLARWEKGEALSMNWSAPRWVSQLSPGGLSEEALAAVFSRPTGKLPSIVGAPSAQGYAFYRVLRENKPSDPIQSTAKTPQDKAQTTQLLRDRYQKLIAQVEWAAWMSALRAQHPVKMSPPTPASSGTDQP